MANNNSYNFITVDNADDLNEGGLHTVQGAPAHEPRDAGFANREALDQYNYYANDREPYVPPLVGADERDLHGPGEPPFKRRANGNGFEDVPEDEAFASINGDSEEAADGTHLGIVDFDEDDYEQ